MIYYVATSLDGFIARNDGCPADFPWDEEFGAHLLEHFPETFPVHLRGSGFSKDDNRRFDTVLMGRKTYEVGLDVGVSSPYPTLDQHVFSRSIQGQPDEDVNIIRNNAAENVRDMKRRGGRAIWLCGGAELATILLSGDLIDRLIVKLNSILFGTGIPLFQEPVQRARLKLANHRAFDSGHVILQYDIT